jgi:predicted secreted Zn-dependent protease
VAGTANTSLQKAYSSSGTSVVPAYLALYAKYTQTGTAATTGSTTFVITWTKADDQ